MKNIKIVTSGAQGTGKTTVLNMFKEAQYPVITEVVRNLVKTKGITINQDGTADTQRAVFNEYVRVLGDTEKYISDRGLTDVISYTLAGVQDGKISEEVYKEQFEATKNFVLAHPDILYVYFPIEFPVVADGVRSVDENYRSQIDQLIKKHLDELGIDYLTVTGTPQERFCQILDWIGPDLF
jgi:predicted ATPase